jgi:prepilin-type N-terminal cleavage/methylation domain-containing protein
MKSSGGFTLIELIVAILIVAILAAVAVPIMRGRIDSAKWSEGKAAMGTIAQSLRAYAVDKGSTGTYPPSLAELGFIPSDLHGNRFTITNYSVPACAFVPGADPELTFTILCTNVGTGINYPDQVILDEAGNWTP